MNIKILDSWLRDYLETKASPSKIAEILSLTSVSIERIEKLGDDFLYDIEITTNRPDLMGVIGLAREAATVLPATGIDATFIPPRFSKPKDVSDEVTLPVIKNDDTLVNRICAVIMEVEFGNSPEYIKKRLESSGIRSINNVVDVTNYVMRETGHPAHVFDYDRLNSKTLIIKAAKKGEKVITLDGKEYTLSGGDIVAYNGEGKIVDLLGIMGIQNSVVTDSTKRILYFIDNNNPVQIRKTSMEHGIRTEAAVINEKGPDPEIAFGALLCGIKLFEKIAKGKVVSKILDIYFNKPASKTVTVDESKINSVIGIDIPLKDAKSTLDNLGFETKITGKSIAASVPSFRLGDITIAEDIIEEIARVYGYSRLPSILPTFQNNTPFHQEKNLFYWEARCRNFFKYSGFTEIYTYALVSPELYEGNLDDAVTLQNPLNEEMAYMRRTLVPSLLEVASDNPSREEFSIFEIANVYLKKGRDLPDERLTLAGIIKMQKIDFFTVKGVIENLFFDFGIKNIEWKEDSGGGNGADIYIDNIKIGTIELLSDSLADFEIDFASIFEHATLKKIYNPIPKFPPVIEDIRIKLSENTTFEKAIKLIKKQSSLISSVKLLDIYGDKITLRITYQNSNKNLTNEEITPIRKKIISNLKHSLKAEIA